MTAAGEAWVAPAPAGEENWRAEALFTGFRRVQIAVNRE